MKPRSHGFRSSRWTASSLRQDASSLAVASVAVCTRPYIQTRVYIYIYMYTHIHTYMHTCIYIYIHTYIHTHIHIHIYIYIYTLYTITIIIYIYIYICILGSWPCSSEDQLGRSRLRLRTVCALRTRLAAN